MVPVAVIYNTTDPQHIIKKAMGYSDNITVSTSNSSMNIGNRLKSMYLNIYEND